MSSKQGIFIGLGILFVWFFYLERSILPPFIVAALFAYLLNPVVNFLSRKVKIPRTISVIAIYAVLFSVIGTIGAVILHQVAMESLDLSRVIARLLDSTRGQIHTLPVWAQPLVQDFLTSFGKSRFLAGLKSPSFNPALFSQAISRVITFFIFLCSGYYFLKDGDYYVNRILSRMPIKHKVDIEVLLIKINNTLADYLRGQIFLVFVVSLMVYIALMILGVPFALTLAVFAGFAEIVPVVGPITAGATAVLVILITGTTHFGLSPLASSLIVAIIYFILRQFEDYFIIPYVMQKVTKLPPLIIFFAVVAGGHLAGILGLILAVPTVAVSKLLLDFTLEKMEKEKK